MALATIVRTAVLASVLVATLTQGRTVSEASGASTTEESTGLTANEEDRIFGGSEADASKFPFVVSLRQNDAGGSTYCGGTLVASRYVVTAAHCVKTDRATIYASIGTAFASGSSDGVRVKVIQGYRHPKYNKSAHTYDVGVLKLEKKVLAPTIALGAADGLVGTFATVRGWGLTENGSQSRKMKEVNVNIISNAECNKQYSNRITGGMLCAGTGNDRDTCNGDSGGPLIANGVLVGIVIWGGKCGVKAGVYTRVAYMRDYINSIVSGGSSSNLTPSASPWTGESRGTESSNANVPATETPSTDAPTPVPITEAPKTDAPTAVPTMWSPVTEAPAAYEPWTEGPSFNQADQSETSTNLAEQIEASNYMYPVEQIVPGWQPAPAATYDPTWNLPASGTKEIESGKDCTSQF